MIYIYIYVCIGVLKVLLLPNEGWIRSERPETGFTPCRYAKPHPTCAQPASIDRTLGEDSCLAPGLCVEKPQCHETKNQASSQASKRASRQAGREANSQTTNQASKQASKQATHQNSKQANKQPSRPANKQASNQSSNKNPHTHTRTNKPIQQPHEKFKELGRQHSCCQFHA